MTWLPSELHEYLYGEDARVACGYCGRSVREALAEFCWFCGGPLCGECWDTIGHCGHREAYQFEREIKRQCHD